MLLPRFPPLQSGAAFSSPAFSCPAFSVAPTGSRSWRYSTGADWNASTWRRHRGSWWWPSEAPVMQTVGKTHKSGCRLQIDVREDRDPGLTELGRRCTTKRESGRGPTPVEVLIGSPIQAFDWYRPRRPWMTLNDVIALIFRFLPKSIDFQADYITVVEDRPIISVNTPCFRKKHPLILLAISCGIVVWF